MPEFQEDALHILSEIEQCEDDEQYRLLRDRLYGLGPQINAILRDELVHPHHLRRMAAATNLGRLGDKHAIVRLLPLLNDPQSEVREMALFALGILGDPSVHEHVVAAFSDFDSDVRYRAIVALADLRYPKLESILIIALEDESYGVREQALSQLRGLGSPIAAPSVLRCLLERELDMQKMAEEALDHIVPKMTRSHYKLLSEQLSPRERRLILNYFEARNLQEVYGSIWQRLQLVAKPAKQERGLDKYGRLLNEEDEKQYLSHAYLRDEMVTFLVDHFRDESHKLSLMLVGDAGTGKTAVVHEFVHRLLEEDPDWKILETNTSELISGTRYLGDWETKLKEMAEAIQKEDKVILYITNPNDLLGAGAHSKSDENFADFFKPYLQRGQLRMITECTGDELRNGLARDPGFLRQFKQVKLAPFNDQETLQVLEKRVSDLSIGSGENTKNIVADSKCLELVVDFARSFYTRTQSPGRACDFLDALIDYASRHQSYEQPEDPLVLQSEFIPPCLSELSGINLDLLDDTIQLDLQETRLWFNTRLIDQPFASETLTDRLALIKTGLSDPKKPLGVFFLVGPTGVGKTYFAKLVAERIFGNSERMIRFDLSEYRGRFAVEKLIGSPHDKDREGLLTEAIRNQPFSVLLFDEFEKADSEIYNLFLQIMDEGRLSDARGHTTDFRQTLIFLTSNLGSSGDQMDAMGFGAGQEKNINMPRLHSKINSKLEDFFAPEFLNRLDEIIVFDALTKNAMKRLVELEVNQALKRRGLTRRNIAVVLDDEAITWLEVNGFSKKFGARALKRTIEKSVLVAVSKILVKRGLASLGIRIFVKNNKLEASLLNRVSKAPGEPKKPTRT